MLGTGGARVGNWAGVSQERRGGESGTGPMCTARPRLSWERLAPRIGFRSDDPTLQVCFKSSFDDLELGLQSSFQLPKGRLYEGNTSDVSCTRTPIRRVGVRVHDTSDVFAS